MQQNPKNYRKTSRSEYYTVSVYAERDIIASTVHRTVPFEPRHVRKGVLEMELRGILP